MYSNLSDNEKALEVIKRNGPSSISELSEHMGVTTEGVRFHLLKLEKEGLVKSRSVAAGRGRPKQIWSLTQEGHDRFPNTHAELTANIIHMMRDTLGEEAVDKVIDRHQQTMKDRYADKIDQDSSLEERVAQLVQLRSREGYMADYKKENDHFVFIENHCPICSAAKVCQGFCKAEILTFKAVLGEDVQIERQDHIIEGAKRCSYRISSN